jgi:curved DNA-binding protein CbpA
MAAAGNGGPDPDLYQLLEVPREAPQQEIAQAWRRRARAEHPDTQPRDAAAPDRFRVLAEAYQVLSDPARRAAYDRTLGSWTSGPGAEVPAARVRPPRPARPGGRPPGPPLRVGPVKVEGAHRAPTADGWDEEEARLTVLALWYLAGKRDRPW